MSPDRSPRSKLVSLSILAATTAVIGWGIYPLIHDIQQAWSQVEPKDKPQLGINLLQTLATTAGGVALFWNIVLTRRQLAAAQEQQITDRFSKAVEQLGHQERSVQIGGIYALERIAQDSPRDHWTIMEVLSAFVRDRRALPPHVTPAPGPVSFDRAIQSAIVVIGRRNVKNDAEDQGIYLSYTDLRQVSFFRDNFSQVRFVCSDLRGANFSRCILHQARFWEAHLEEANLGGCDLTDASLESAHLQGADLTDAILTRTNLKDADLKDVKGLTVEQVKSAKYWQEAIYDLAFLQLLGSV